MSGHPNITPATADLVVGLWADLLESTQAGRSGALKEVDAAAVRQGVAPYLRVLLAAAAGTPERAALLDSVSSPKAAEAAATTLLSIAERFAADESTGEGAE